MKSRFNVSWVVAAGLPSALALAVLMGSGAGCELIATADRSRIGQGGSGAQGGTTPEGGGGSTCSPETCPGVDTDCSKRACAGDTCTTENENAGTACSESADPGAKVCDGSGTCVSCNDADDCSGDDLCVDSLCVPATCVNNERDGDESDVDCGGSCSPCANGDDCGGLADCQSGFCDDGTCAACTPGGSDCAASQYCDAGTCVDQLVLGDVCTDAVQCASGFCPAQDGVCCDTACDSTCLACLTAKNGGAGNGTCGAVPSGEDPDTECPADVLQCQVGGCNGNAGAPACTPAGNGVLCRAGSGDMCDPDEVCADGACPADVFDNGSTVCRMGSGDVCDPDESCPGMPGMACPTDVVLPATQSCRAQQGNCDLPDDCPGTPGGACPDAIAPHGTIGSPTDCGNYYCDGVQKTCPDFCDEDEDCVGAITCNTGPNRCM